MFLALDVLQKSGPLLAWLIRNRFTKNGLERTPESAGVMQEIPSVEAYVSGLESSLAISYALSAEVIARTGIQRGGVALDLCCGPGHLTTLLVKHLKMRSATGMDLSKPMLEQGRLRAAKEGFTDRLEYREGDITRLSSVKSASVDLCTFSNAAHHFDSVDAVRGILGEMDRVTRPDGVVFVTDLVRLKSARLTERYVEIVARDYAAAGLEPLLRDFRNSLYASWSEAEFRSMAPKPSQRKWFYWLPRGVPSSQFLIGFPSECPMKGRKLPRPVVESIVAKKDLPYWWMARQLLFAAKPRLLR